MDRKQKIELKKEINIVLNTVSTIKQKGREFKKLNKKYNVFIELVTDGIGVNGVFVTENDQPLFKITSDQFMEALKQRKEELFKKLSEVVDNDALPQKEKRKLVKKIGKEYDAKLDLDGKKVLIPFSSRWLYYTRWK